MDAETLAAFAGKAAYLNLAYLVAQVFIITGCFALLVKFGERAMGLNLRDFVNDVEKAAAAGNVWPGVVSFIVVPSALLGLVFYIALR